MNTQENQAATDTKDPEDALDPRQVQAIDLLVQGWTMEAAAQKIGVSARSIRRWKQDAEFAGELREAIGEVLDNAQLRINPLILRAERQANRSFRINDELLESTDYNVVSKACNHASNNAIKWIKLLLVLRKAEATQNLTGLAKSLTASATTPRMAPRIAAFPLPSPPLRRRRGGRGVRFRPRRAGRTSTQKADKSGRPKPHPFPFNPSPPKALRRPRPLQNPCPPPPPSRRTRPRSPRPA